MKRQKLPYNDDTRPPEAENRFHFWLIIVALAIFILLLFYSQKIHGQV